MNLTEIYKQSLTGNFNQPVDLSRMAQVQQNIQTNFYQTQGEGAKLCSELEKEIGKLDKSELEALMREEDHINANSTYEKMFFSYLMYKFKEEFNETDGGKQVLKSMLETVKKLTDKVNYEAKEKQKLVNKLLEKLESNPDLLNLINQ